MKKLCFYSTSVLALGLFSLACNRPSAVPSAPSAGPSTPICGMSAPVTLPSLGLGWAGYSQTNPPTGAPFCVVRNNADWQSFWGSSTPPPPPADFSTQMLIIVVNYGICPVRTASITNVCEDAALVNVSVKDPSHDPYNSMCAGPLYGYTATAVAVANSSLPVTWTVDTTP